jgi:predicted RNase H-like nuclease
VDRARRAVLGIDAAWTAGQPSGVAVVVEAARGRGWRCAGVAPSYDAFVGLAAGAPVDWCAPRIGGGEPDVGALLAAAARLAPGAVLSVVAVDMPLARGAIVRRREADDAVSRAFGARGLGAHSPSARRPGPLSHRMHRALARRGFSLATAEGPGAVPAAQSLLEVFPHAAVLELLASGYRVPYKAARAGRYWPEATPADRRARLVEAWRRILRALRARISTVDLPLPRAAPAHGRMKRLEDALDALVCAWVGIEFLAGRARAYGDAEAAVWTPERRARNGAGRALLSQRRPGLRPPPVV